jgi:hypothetical protein
MIDVYADKILGIDKGPFPEPTFELDVELDCNKHLNPINESDTLQTQVDDIGEGFL